MTPCDNDNIFHITHPTLVSHEVLVEVCERCKEMFVWQKDKYGRIDNAANIHVNARKFLQRDDEHFEKEYGKWAPGNTKKMEESSLHNMILEDMEREEDYNQENAIHKIL